jgi:hypothetical protein
LAAGTTRFDASRVSFGEKVAGVSAVVLLISLWLPWYGVTVKAGGFVGVKIGGTFNAWESFGGRDLYLLLLSIFVIAWVGGRAFGLLSGDIGFDPALVAVIAGAIGVVFVLIGILHIPNHGINNAAARVAGVDFSRKYGLFIGFLATCGVTFGAWTAYNERRRGLVPAAAGPGGALGGPGAIGPSEGATPAAATAAATTPAATTPAAGPATSGASTAPAGTGTSTPTPAASAPPPQQNPPADWYPDPHGQARLRWWDGSQWTDQTAN